MKQGYTKLITLAVAGLSVTAAACLSSAMAQQSKKSDVAREQEDAALAFAREHHPELADLLDELQDSNPKGYRNAIREVARDSARLERLRERTPERYELELQAWKIGSRIRLAAAQSAMSDADETRAQLRELLVERNAIKLELLRLERERLTERIARIDGSIERLEADPDAAAEQELDQLLRRARSRVEQVKRGGKNKPPSGTSSESSRKSK